MNALRENRTEPIMPETIHTVPLYGDIILDGTSR